MPIKIPDHLPAREILKQENIFVMDESRAFHQDIRPLQIGILNLMPKKQETEVQLLRLIGNSALQIEITLLHMESHVSKNTPQEYLTAFYHVFDDVKELKFDGLIITGAPVEHLEFEKVNYWNELARIMEWSKSNVTSTFHICWGAQAALYYHYGIQKYPLPKKMFGIFPHFKHNKNEYLTRGFDDRFSAPHSRHTEIRREDVLKHAEIKILAESEEAGLYLLQSQDGRQIFVTGHSEYDPNTLKTEYERDVEKGLSIDIPKYYFKDDDPSKEPVVTWKSHSHLLFNNWLNYSVYQPTPFDINRIGITIHTQHPIL